MEDEFNSKTSAPVYIGMKARMEIGVRMRTTIYKYRIILNICNPFLNSSPYVWGSHLLQFVSFLPLEVFHTWR